MAVEAYRKLKVNRAYRDVFIKRRLNDGTYDADWTDITNFVVNSGVGSINYKLDSSDFDIGVFTVDNIGMTFDNKKGKFNDKNDSRSYWAGLESPHLTKLKVNSAYIDSNGDKIDVTIFQGFFDERSIKKNANDVVSATILSREFVFSFVAVTAVTSTQLSGLFLQLLSRGIVTDNFNVSSANINPDLDFVVDNISGLENQKLNAVLNHFLFLSNSIMYIDTSDNIIIKPRAESATTTTALYSNIAGQSDNIYSINNLNSGRHRVKNFFYWGALESISTQDFLDLYGVTRKSIASDYVTTGATQQTIIDNLLSEWQHPKREMEITCEYLGQDVKLLDRITCGVTPTYSRTDGLPQCGDVVCGSTNVVGFESGLLLEKEIGWKILEMRHNIQNMTTFLKVREIGTGTSDNYI